MKKILIPLFAASLLMLASSAFAEHGSFDKCLGGCLPGVNSCNNCCNSFFVPLLDQCLDNFKDCDTSCHGIGFRACKDKCESNFMRCRHIATSMTEIDFNCPNWQGPKECPYNCQTWNPATRHCVGAPMNVCQ